MQVKQKFDSFFFSFDIIFLTFWHQFYQFEMWFDVETKNHVILYNFLEKQAQGSLLNVKKTWSALIKAPLPNCTTAGVCELACSPPGWMYFP